MYITLEQAKKHLLVDSDFTDDDEYITSLIKVAEDSVEQHLDIALSELEEGEDCELPPSVIQAMLLMIGNFYQNREAVTYTTAMKLPLGYEYLIGLYRRYTVR